MIKYPFLVAVTQESINRDWCQESDGETNLDRMLQKKMSNISLLENGSVPRSGGVWPFAKAILSWTEEIYTRGYILPAVNDQDDLGG